MFFSFQRAHSGLRFHTFRVSHLVEEGGAFLVAVQNLLAALNKCGCSDSSKACPMCGYCDEKNRPKHGLLFICQNEKCPYRLRSGHAYTLHADLVGARNIAMRAFCIRQDWI